MISATFLPMAYDPAATSCAAACALSKNWACSGLRGLVRDCPDNDHIKSGGVTCLLFGGETRLRGGDTSRANPLPGHRIEGGRGSDGRAYESGNSSLRASHSRPY